MMNLKTSANQAEQILQTLAVSHPDFTAFQQTLTGLKSAPLTPELLQDTLNLLAEDPQQATAIKALNDDSNTLQQFNFGGEIIPLIAVVFLLRTHFKLERSPNGRWQFLLEHKPANNTLLSELLKKLQALIE